MNIKVFILVFLNLFLKISFNLLLIKRLRNLEKECYEYILNETKYRILFKLITYISSFDNFMSNKSIKCSCMKTCTNFIDFMNIIYIRKTKTIVLLKEIFKTYNDVIEQKLFPIDDMI